MNGDGCAVSKAKDVDVRALEIGSKVRDLRLKQGLTLKNVSDGTGLSKPLISQIENNRVVPPVATLLKIARCLKVSPGYFFQEAETQDRIAITRKSERQTGARPHHRRTDVGYTYEILEIHKPEKLMEPFRVTFDVTDEADMAFFSHEGEECVHVVSGRLEFRTRDQVHALSPGDTLYFDSTLPHAFRSLGPEPAQALIVIHHGHS